MRIVRFCPVLYILTFFFYLPLCQAQTIQNSTKYNKILVYAKVEQSDVESKFEDAMVKALQEKGYKAVPSHSSFTTAEITNTNRLVAKADSMNIDALLAFTLINVETAVSRTPQVSASVGLPVRVGFFNVFLGTSFPLGGGTVEEKTVNAEVGLYTDRNSAEPSWKMNLQGDLSDGVDYLIKDFVKKTIKALTKGKKL